MNDRTDDLAEREKLFNSVFDVPLKGEDAPKDEISRESDESFDRTMKKLRKEGVFSEPQTISKTKIKSCQGKKVVERREKFFTTYWTRETWIQHQNRLDGVPLEHSASEQFTPQKVSIGDSIYIFNVSSPECRLFLGGRVKVAWIGSMQEACEKLGTDDVWEASYHVISNEEDCLPMIFDLDVTDIASQLRFISKTQNRLIINQGKINYWQFRVLRELTPESAYILDQCLKKALQKAPTKTLRQRISHLKSALGWPLEYNDFFSLWVKINNLYRKYILVNDNGSRPSEKQEIEAFCNDVEKKQIQLSSVWKASHNLLSSQFLKDESYHDNSPWVLESLKKLKNNQRNLSDLLLIIYKLRCNLFHGEAISVSPSQNQRNLELIGKSINILQAFLDELFAAQL